MTYASDLNQRLQKNHPAAFRCLSSLGQRLFFPKGVPIQAAEAKECEINATIGQLKDDYGMALPLPVMSEKICGLSNEEVFLYTPQGGRPDLRHKWKEKVFQECGVPCSLPVICCGLTHGLSTTAALFVDEETTVLLPTPRWGNYDLVFATRCKGQVLSYDIMSGSGQNRTWSLNIDGIARSIALLEGKGLLVLNFPTNPSGYTPTEAEVDVLVEVISKAKGPLTILLDEAYHGMEWVDSCYKKSLLTKLSNLDRERFLVVKIDGATKELFFFGGRVAFITYGTDGDAAKVLQEKTCASIPSSISAIPSPSQALVLSALMSPDLEKQKGEILSLLKERFIYTQQAVEAQNIDHWPFNSAFFALFPCEGDPHVVRKRLITKGLGCVAVPTANALRLSYSTVSKVNIPKMISILSTELGCN